jgi:MFS family permease
MVLIAEVGLFAAAYVWFAFDGGFLLVASAFLLAGLGIGCVETARHAAVARAAPANLRGSAFGLLAPVQAGGNLAASAVAGLLWTAVSPEAAFAYLTACAVTAATILIRSSR